MNSTHRLSPNTVVSGRFRAIKYSSETIVLKRNAIRQRLDLPQRCRFFSLVVTNTIFDENPKFMAPSFSSYDEWLLQFIATGRTDLQQRLEVIALSIVNRGPHAPPADTTGYFTVPSKLGVFALEMLAAVRGETIR